MPRATFRSSLRALSLRLGFSPAPALGLVWCADEFACTQHRRAHESASVASSSPARQRDLVVRSICHFFLLLLRRYTFLHDTRNRPSRADSEDWPSKARGGRPAAEAHWRGASSQADRKRAKEKKEFSTEGEKVKKSKRRATAQPARARKRKDATISDLDNGC